jgi:predicted amidohydrolase YtcJ
MAQIPAMEMLTAAMGHETVQRDLRGGFVLPGLIDAHVHVTAISADLGSLGATSPFYIAAHSVPAFRSRRRNELRGAVAMAASTRPSRLGAWAAA